jgi:hypothetical protein
MNPWWSHKDEQGFNLGEYAARFRGALLQLFGAPSHTTSLAEESYDYMIEATDEHGSTWVFTVYEGSSGPAIGGNGSAEGAIQAVGALVALIESTPPADFEATIYYEDTDWTVIYGCKDGVCYYHEIEGDCRK